VRFLELNNAVARWEFSAKSQISWEWGSSDE